MTKVAINGLGRIGRALFKVLMDTPELELVAINDLISTKNLAYLLRFDSVYGRYAKNIIEDNNTLFVADQLIKVLHFGAPQNLPWEQMEVDIVFECTGKYRTPHDLARHRHAGARYVILSAPAKDHDMRSLVYGVNQMEHERPSYFSAASCTTNCVAPVAEIMDRRFGVVKAIMNSIHSYTSSQALVDMPNDVMERGRAAAINMVPTHTGAAFATAEILPHYIDRFDGTAVRVPTPVGSLCDMVFVIKSTTTAAEVNEVFRQEAASNRYRGVLGVSEDPLVSSDIIQDPRASVIDLLSTRVVDGDLVKVMSWYDNEWGYANQMVRQAQEIVRWVS